MSRALGAKQIPESFRGLPKPFSLCGEKTKSLSEALLTEALIFSRSLGGALLARGLLWYSTKLKNILGDFGNRPGFRSSLHEHIGFHDLATDWPQ